MTVHGDFEIRLRRAPGSGIEAEFRLNDPEKDVEAAPSVGLTGIDPVRLRELETDDEAYGRELAAQLWKDPDLLACYSNAKQAFDAPDRALRVRLLISPEAADLHTLRWELLIDPKSNALLSKSQRILFSRFMFSSDWRSARKLEAKSALRVLIAVAAPKNIKGDRGLEEVDSAGEFTRAKKALAQLKPDTLGEDPDVPVTLNALIKKIEAGVDVLYLVCHGFCTETVAGVFLQNKDGDVEQVLAADFAVRIANVPDPPRLVVLASCESAKSGTSALAPLLAAAGVPAILAMQETIAMSTVEALMPEFFTQLLIDGQIDRALASARAALPADALDYWVPALFIRLRWGRLWYEPGFTGKGDMDQWQDICRSVNRGRFVPILGPDFAEHIYGDSRSLARGIAKQRGYSGGTDGSLDIAKVAQFLSARSSWQTAADYVQDAMEEKRAQVTSKQLNDPDDPCHILAAMNPKMCVITTPDPLFETYVKSVGNEPVIVATQWRNECEPDPFHLDPEPKKPLLYYVFGTYRTDKQQRTWALTEDDFFDYLIKTSQYNLMPGVVSDGMMGGSLLFLGFPLDDWKFRVLLRMLVAKGGSSQLTQFNHVAVQLNPDEHTLADAARFKRALSRYFTQTANADIYWGSTADFLRQLRDKRLEK